jgi:16S rRNA (guanine966-N2)-methyltransferase
MKRRGEYQRRPERGSAAGHSGPSRGRGAGQVRIVGGEFRGRRLRVATAPGLRPTPERTRETLFNWLQGELEGARVLDLFAGSGALALEALSRGAASALLIERHRAAAAALREAAATLAPQRARVVEADAQRWLARTEAAADPPVFDLVFLDPPFASPLAALVLAALAAGSLLAPDARVYVEWPADAPAPWGEANWTVRRETRTGDSRGALLLAGAPEPSTTAA